MQNATIVTVVGAGSAEVISSLGSLRGVEALRLGSADAESTARINAARGPYVVHDADPLEHVAAAWVEFYDDRSTLGTLELEVSVALEAFAAGERVMPDYYVVLDPESIEGTWRHWWFGALGSHGVRRVVPAPAAAWPVRRLLGRLPQAPGWAAPREWLPGLPFVVPDRVGLGGV